MPTRDPRIDAYIAKSADFARPILIHLRQLVHTACPDVRETMKWSFPFFDHHGILCNMAAFKQHCTFGFWKGALIFDGKQDPAVEGGGGMRQFGRITRLTDLPADRKLIGYIKKAAALNEAGIDLPARSRSTAKKILVVPDDLKAALKKNKKAQTAFDDFSYSHKKEYVEWINEAKREETRRQRLATTLQWLTEGKSRHWKYARS